MRTCTTSARWRTKVAMGTPDGPKLNRNDQLSWLSSYLHKSIALFLAQAVLTPP